MSATDPNGENRLGSTAEQSAAYRASLFDRDRTLEALHALEAALGTAAPGREADWFDQVIGAFTTLESAISSERDESLRADSLLSMIGQTYPRRFGSRVRQLRDQIDDIIRQLEFLRAQLERLDRDEVDFADLRQRLGWLIRAIHHRRARESDLVFEAVRLDLGEAASSG
jgi:hypothetical protein